MKWVYYVIDIPKINLIHKIDKGFVDLEFSGYGDKIIELKNYIISVIDDLSNNGVGLFKTGKAATLRIHVPKINFDVDLKKDEEKIKKCLHSVSKLHDIAYKLIQHGIEII